MQPSRVCEAAKHCCHAVVRGLVMNDQEILERILSIKVEINDVKAHEEIEPEQLRDYLKWKLKWRDTGKKYYLNTMWSKTIKGIKYELPFPTTERGETSMYALEVKMAIRRLAQLY